MQYNKKKFIGSLISISFLFLVFKSIFGGILYACAAFFTKLKLEDWNSKNKK
jgi:hypothetical protein